MQNVYNKKNFLKILKNLGGRMPPFIYLGPPLPVMISESGGGQ